MTIVIQNAQWIFNGRNKMKDFTDTELLDYLQQETEKEDYTGRVICRHSTSGRGWRLHETSWRGSCTNVREAISNFIRGKT